MKKIMDNKCLCKHTKLNIATQISPCKIKGFGKDE